MINLAQNTLLARCFVWSCDHLPFTATRDYSEGKPRDGERRTGAHYIEHGTTLCHLFWAILWVPLIVAAFAAFLAVVLAEVHLKTYEQYGYKMGIAAFFLPEIWVLGCGAIAGLIILVIFGCSKSGFFKMLWLYLKGIKSRICPLIAFTGTEPAE